MGNFFENIQGFPNFQSFADPKVYTEAPDSWFVVLTDVRGSTDAIQQGKYRDVNTLGAASIAVVQSEMNGEKIPFVFGGDGASFLVPPEKIEQVKVALQKLIALSKLQFGFELRVGVVAVREVHAAGQKILIGKFQINSHSFTAVVKGGGLTWSEKKIKAEPQTYCLQPLLDQFAVPNELSCRWRPIKSKKGVVLSLLIQPRDADLTAIQKLADEIQTVCGGDFENSNPVQLPQLMYKGLFGMLIDELKFQDKIFTKKFLGRYFQIFLCWWAFKLRLPAPFRAKEYKSELGSHSDYRKFDEVLRMILDCSKVQAEQIVQILERGKDRGDIFFGLHESTHALMTCLVESIQTGGHVHFVDGSAGGYAMAAKQLKKQVTYNHLD